MQYPLLNSQNKWADQSNGFCPICNANLQETGFVWLTMQSDLYTSRGNTFGNIPAKLHWESYLNIGFHGSEEANSLRKDRCLYFSIPVVDGFQSCGMEFQFCSTQCARVWFNRMMDDLDRILQKKWKNKHN